MHNIASNLTQLCFDDLDGPPVVVGSRNWITPAAELEALFFPQVSWVLDAVHERIQPLKGYTPKSNQSLEELARRAKAGV
jgi:2-oxoisovalerate dehydrogenase E1 component